MDNLLAVAELELELQDRFQFPRDGDTMPFRAEDKPADEALHDDLFESISAAHYLPELAGPHDEALLDSLVEKGCEDNQILGQALDKLAHLVASEYDAARAVPESVAPGPASPGSPARSNMTAAQGLLHLHRAPEPHRYVPPADFTEPSASPPAELPGSDDVPTAADVERVDYERGADERLPSEAEATDALFTPVPDLHDSFDAHHFAPSPRASPAMSPERPEPAPPPLALEPAPTSGTLENEIDEEIGPEVESDIAGAEEIREKRESIEDLKPDVEQLAKVAENPEAPKDLSVVYVEDDGEPRDLTVRRRTPAPAPPPLPSPRRIEIPRAPSRESDAMQSPQPSGIPAIASPEVFQAPPSKSKTQSILDAMFTSSSPKMYLTSEVSITKQQCEPLNLGKHRKSASPTVSSCSEERPPKAAFGEPLEKRHKRGSVDELYQITRLLAEKRKRDDKTGGGRSEPDSQPPSSLKQFQSLKANKNFNIPDPLLIPKDRFAAIQNAPGREIPALLVERPDLRYSEDLDDERDRDIIVISHREFEDLLGARDLARRRLTSKFDRISESAERPAERAPAGAPGRAAPAALAEDIEAATSASLAPMLWAQYAQRHMDAAAVSSQNEFLKALGASGYGAGYADLSQMLPGPARPAVPPGYPTLADFERAQVVLWQELMMQRVSPQRRKSSSEAHAKDAKADFQSPYVHSTNKAQQGRAQAARASPLDGYARGQAHPYLAGLYPAPGRGAPAGPYYPGAPQYYAGAEPARAGPAPEPRPRISVKKVAELRRRDDAEVSTTLPDAPPDSSAPLWHPLFGNQKNYTSPWSWTTVTATGD